MGIMGYRIYWDILGYNGIYIYICILCQHETWLFQHFIGEL